MPKRSRRGKTLLIANLAITLSLRYIKGRPSTPALKRSVLGHLNYFGMSAMRNFREVVRNRRAGL